MNPVISDLLESYIKCNDVSSLTSVTQISLHTKFLRQIKTMPEGELMLFRKSLQNEMPKILIVEILTQHIDPISKLNDEIRVHILQVCLAAHIKRLTLHDFNSRYYDILLDTIIMYQPRLEVLDLKKLYLHKNEHISKLYQILQQSRNLKVLRIWTLSSVDVFMSILKYAPILQVLDVENNLLATSLTVDEIKKWNIYYNIVDINFGECFGRIEPKIYAEILHHFPKLRIIRNYNECGNMLQNLSTTTTELTMIADTNTDSSNLGKIKKHCPLLYKLELIQPSKSAMLNLKWIKTLTTLCIEKANYNTLLKGLKSCGENIRSLTLSSMQGKMNFQNLFKICPNLVYLKCHCMKFDDFSSTDVTYPSLAALHLVLDSTVTPDIFRIMNGIEHACVHEWNNVSTHDLQRVFEKSSLKHLTYLEILNAPLLDLSIVDIILKFCPKIEHIHGSSTWMGTNNKIKLRQKLNEKNLYLCLDCDNVDPTFYHITNYSN